MEATGNETNMAIFDQICEIVLNPKFQEAQGIFFQNNMALFDETADENKLEYTNVFGSYIHILDEMIEAQLKEKFSDEQLAQFFESYAKNKSLYEARNSNVHETLFAMVDFTKFKEQILSYKKENLHKMSKNEEEKQSQTYILNLAKYQGENGIFDQLVNEDLNDKSLGWEKITESKEDKGLAMAIWRRPIVPKSDIMMSRADVTIRNRTLRSANYVFGNYEEAIKGNKELKDKIVKMDVLERSEDTQVFHYIMKMGLLMDSRESIIRLTKKKISDTKYLWITQSLDRPDIPVPKDTYRIEIHKSTMIEQVGPDLVMTNFDCADMKGYIPKSLLNMVIGAMAMKGMRNIQDKCEEAEADLVSGKKTEI